MEIVVKEIPLSGLDLSFRTNTDPWFQKLVSDALLQTMDPADIGTAEIHLYRTGDNVNMDGDISCECHQLCSRCTSPFVTTLDIPVHYAMVPLFDSEMELKRRGEQEVELVKEDLDFNFYEGDRFDMGALLRELVILAIPMQPICKTDCKGLCPICGENLNQKPCSCAPAQADPRWTSLQQLKVKKQK